MATAAAPPPHRPSHGVSGTYCDAGDTSTSHAHSPLLTSAFFAEPRSYPLRLLDCERDARRVSPHLQRQAITQRLYECVSIQVQVHEHVTTYLEVLPCRIIADPGVVPDSMIGRAIAGRSRRRWSSAGGGGMYVVILPQGILQKSGDVT